MEDRFLVSVHVRNHNSVNSLSVASTPAPALPPPTLPCRQTSGSGPPGAPKLSQPYPRSRWSLYHPSLPPQYSP